MISYPTPLTTQHCRLVWSQDDQRHYPTVVVRMTPWTAESRAQVLADWSAIADMMDEGSGYRSERRFAGLLMGAALAALGQVDEAEAASARILADLGDVPELRDPLLIWNDLPREDAD